MNTYTLTASEWFPVRHMGYDCDIYESPDENTVVARYNDGRYIKIAFHDDNSVTITEGKEINLGFGYSPHVDWEALELSDLELSFVSELPHGSGIDYDWIGERQINGKLRLSNAYHFMNEHGFYVGSLDFTVIVDKNDMENFRLEFNGLNSTGYRWVSRLGLRDYLEDTIVWSVDKATCEHKMHTVNDHGVSVCSGCYAIV